MSETTSSAAWTMGEGRYEIKRKLGEGGMAFALLALDKTLGADVVLKVPKPNMMADPEFARRFRREIRSMQELTHEHIVKIKDVGEHEGMPFYVMDLLAGGSLQDRFELAADNKIKPMPPESLADWLEPVARALDFIHQRFVHRDIKPANILFDAYGNAFVSDFGIVKAISDGSKETQQTVMTQAGMVIGTGPYMAPEVSEGKSIDGRADQYALAATAYQALSGRVPFNGTTIIEILRQQLIGKIPPLHELVPTLPKLLSQVVEKGLSQDAKERYANCTAFAKAVLAAAKAMPAGNKTKATPKAVCPACRKPFALPPDPAGKSVKCPACAVAFVVTRRSGPPRAVRGQATSVAAAAKTPPATMPVARFAEPLTKIAAHSQERTSSDGKRRHTYFVAAAIIVPICALGLLALAWNPWSGKKEPNATEDSTALKVDFQKGKINSIGMKLVYIPPGKFTMGSTKSEQELVAQEFSYDWAEHEILHDVEISKGFYMGVFTVTQAEWKSVMGNNPSWFCAGGGGEDQVAGEDTRRFPVEMVSWNDAQEFCRKLSQIEGETYRLPTEAEWEYACRAGTKTVFNFGDTISTDQANYSGMLGEFTDGKEGENRGRPTKVGRFPANSFGLHDMHGNVVQWCEDWHSLNYYVNSPSIDPVNTEAEAMHVVRGGAWGSKGGGCRAAHRYYPGVDFAPENGFNFLGFRVVLQTTKTEAAPIKLAPPPLDEEANAKAAPFKPAPSPPNEEAAIANLKQVLLTNTWHYRDSLYPPGELFRFNADGTWHQFRWNYWVTGPQSIRVHYDRNNRN